MMSFFDNADRLFDAADRLNNLRGRAPMHDGCAKWCND